MKIGFFITARLKSTRLPKKLLKILDDKLLIENVIDRIKEVIKAPPNKHPAIQKFYALKLLNKCVLKKNTELNNYVE